MQAHRRRDISDKIWKMLKPHLPGCEERVGRPASDNRLFINAVFWILRTGAPWRDLPPDYGDWKNTHRRFCCWRDRGVWENLLESFIIEPDYEWLMIDASHCKVHPHVAGAIGGNQAMSRTKGNSTPKFTWPWNAHGMPVRVIVTEGTRADCREACALIDGLRAEALVADRGYDTDEIIEMAVKNTMQSVIPAKKNRQVQRDYDKYLYKLRYLVENAFLHLRLSWKPPLFCV